MELWNKGESLLDKFLPFVVPVRVPVVRVRLLKPAEAGSQLVSLLPLLQVADLGVGFRYPHGPVERRVVKWVTETAAGLRWHSPLCEGVDSLVEGRVADVDQEFGNRGDDVQVETEAGQPLVRGVIGWGAPHSG